MPKRILIADDEEDVKEVMELLLESQGYEVETAYDGLDALDRAKTFSPDLILLDIMMPVVDGIEVCRQLKADAQTKPIPVIMISAASRPEKEAQALRVGAADYMIKPFEPESLLNKIHSLLEKASI